MDNSLASIFHHVANAASWLRDSPAQIEGTELQTVTSEKSDVTPPTPAPLEVNVTVVKDQKNKSPVKPKAVEDLDEIQVERSEDSSDSNTSQPLLDPARAAAEQAEGGDAAKAAKDAAMAGEDAAKAGGDAAKPDEDPAKDGSQAPEEAAEAEEGCSCGQCCRSCGHCCLYCLICCMECNMI